MAVYLVDVSLPCRVITGVKVRLNVHGAAHGDVIGQQAVEPAYQRGHGDARGRIEMRHLSQRVHTGVGASGPVQPDLRVRNP